MTNRYAAAMAGAPGQYVFGLRRNPLGFRTQSSISVRSHTESYRQNHLGGSELYIENSPLFHLPKVSTPLLIMHNDKDGAVPGIKELNYIRV